MLDAPVSGGVFESDSLWRAWRDTNCEDGEMARMVSAPAPAGLICDDGGATVRVPLLQARAPDLETGSTSEARRDFRAEQLWRFDCVARGAGVAEV